MVAPQDVHASGVSDLHSEQETDSLNALPSPVDVVTQEEVARLGGQSAVLEQPQHIVVLAVDVPADLEGSCNLEQHGLFEEDGLNHPDEPQDLPLLEAD